MGATEAFTRKGLATRARIVEAAAELVLARGVTATTMQDVRERTKTSKSQLTHYFPAGKADLVSALAEWQAARLFEAQQPHIDELDSWESWAAWSRAVAAYYAEQPYWGCPIGSIVNEMAGSHDQIAAAAQQAMLEWQRRLEAGVGRMVDAGLIAPDTDAHRLGRTLLAILQGGLLMTKTTRTAEPLGDALDAVRTTLAAHAPRRRCSTLSR